MTNGLSHGDQDITPLAYLALGIEAHEETTGPRHGAGRQVRTATVPA
jgi:hypothetical protein